MPNFAIDRQQAAPLTMSNLSILIPTYNDICVSLVEDLHRLCSCAPQLNFEIIVADDGSTMQSTVSVNQQINNISHCRYILRPNNVGRAAIRNFLAQSAQYDKLLFIDSHMSVISDEYITRYLQYADTHPIVCGGYTIPQEIAQQPENLRWKYEMKCLHLQTAEERQNKTYANFHTSNFFISASVMRSHPLDERFRRYGYEDVLYGKHLLLSGIPIFHIDNPLGFCRFESNERFMTKTEEGLQTLYEFREELRDNSRMLQMAQKVTNLHLRPLLKCLYRTFRKPMRKHLTGHHPSLLVFNLYRLGYILSLPVSQQKEKTYP